MIIDPSALIAILRDERDAIDYARAIAAAAIRRISAANYSRSRRQQSSPRAVILSQAAGLTISCARRDLRSSQSQRLRRTLPAKLTVISAGEAAIPPV